MARLRRLLQLIGAEFDSQTQQKVTELKLAGKVNHALQLGIATFPESDYVGLQLGEAAEAKEAAKANPATPQLTAITHNRMLIPANAQLLSFSYEVRLAGQGNQLRARVQLDSGDLYELATVSLATVGGITTVDVPVPAEIRGKVATLTFDVVAIAQNELKCIVWLDDFEFGHVVNLIEYEPLALPLLTGDSEGVTFGAPKAFAAPPAGQPDSIVTITIDGPLGEFMKKQLDFDLELVSQTFTLTAGSGEVRTFAAVAKTYDELVAVKDAEGKPVSFGLQNMTRDRLYGAKITFARTDFDADGAETQTITPYYLYRWVDVVDGTQAKDKTGITAVFHNTLIDGPGNFVRHKNVDMFLPTAFQTTFQGANPFGEFAYGGPTSGSVTKVWTFDPTTNLTDPWSTVLDETIQKKDLVTIQADGTDVGNLVASGRASFPTTININLEGYRTELKRVLLALQPEFLGGQPVAFYQYPDTPHKIYASQQFMDEFAGYMPWDTFNTVDLDNFINYQATLLQGEVEQDFSPANVDATGFVFVTSGGDVTMTWNDVPADVDGKPLPPGVTKFPGIYGSADFDRSTSVLKDVFPDTDLGNAARQWALAEYLNIKRINDGQFAVALNIAWTSAAAGPNDGVANFAGFVANSVSHELGHTFGLNEGYSIVGNQAFNAKPNDIMRAGNFAEGNLKFDPRNINLLRAALGIQADGDLPLTAELQLYRAAFNLPDDVVGLRDSSQPADADPLAIFQWFASGGNVEPAPVPQPTPALEDPAVTPQEGILNGSFDASNAADPSFVWTVHGAATVVGGEAMLSEDPAEQTGFSQTFIVPEATTALRFTLTGLDLLANGSSSPPDAFEVALLNANTGASLVGTATGLGQTDSFLNVQQSGEVFFAPSVSVPGVSVSGQQATLQGPLFITVDLSGVPAGTVAKLYFDLLGFGALGSVVRLDDVLLLGPVSNQAPVAVADSYAVNEDDTLTVTSGLGVLANDGDAEGDVLSAVLVAEPAYGTLELNADGSFTYTPGADYHGGDSFTYRVSDGSLTSDVATVSITVNAVNDAPVIQTADLSLSPAVILEGDWVHLSGTFADADGPEGHSITVNWGDGSPDENATPGMGGFAPTSHRYLDNAVTGPYRLTVTVSDGIASASAEMDVTIVNVAPTVSAGADATINQGSAFSRIGSFSDPGTDAWTATVNYGDGSGDQPLTLAPDGSFALAHAYAAAGTFTVTVAVRDDEGVGSDVILVSVNPIVNSLRGTTYRDVTGNGLGAGDLPQGGVTVKLYRDADNNGSFTSADPLIGTTVTTADGSYDFSDVTAGRYFVKEIVPGGWIRTYPLFSDHLVAEVTATSQVTGLDFANYLKPDKNAISGFSYLINGTTTVNDLTGHAHEGDQVEVVFTVKAGYSDVMLSLVSYTAPEPYFNASTASQQKVFESQTGVFQPGTHRLKVVVPDSYYQVDFVAGAVIDRLGPANSNVFYTPQNRLFDADNNGSHAPVANPSRVGGVVYRDLDNDGVQDAGEPGLGGVTITLTGTDQQGNPVSRTRLTRIDGSYDFSNLRAGNYVVTETQPAGYRDGLDALDGIVLVGSIGSDSIPLTLLGDEVRRQNHFGEGAVNAAPVISAVQNSAACGGQVVEGQAVSVQVQFTDADADDAHTALIQWGDGTTSTAFVDESGGVGSALGSHVYAQGGSYTVVVTLIDGSGSATATTTAMITGARVHDGVLEIVGTNADDVVTIDRLSDGSYRVDASFFGAQSSRTYDEADVERIIVRLCDGNDRATIASDSVGATLDGGRGNDELTGGGGDDVLIGGEGDDVLYGKDGRDLLIGGFGADRLVGNAGEDILIAGATAFDDDQDALDAIMAEWTSGHSYTTRVNNLRGVNAGQGFGDRHNGNVFLRVDGNDATVADDGVRDELTGNSSRDWFFANLDSGVRDQITDRQSNETASDLDPQ